MKKGFITAAILSILLIGCKENTTSTDNPDHTEIAGEHSSEDILSNAWTKDITLDHGKKWEANAETNEGVEKMISLIEEQEKKTVADYHQLASHLNEVKNYVVKECTMDGPSHDNLHVFLHPLIEKITALGKVSTVERGAEITDSIRKNLDQYYQFFQ